MLRRMITLASVCAMLVTTLMAANVLAAEGETSTSILVQNLSSDPADVVVSFYDNAGANTGSKSVTDLCGECTATFDQRYGSGDPGTAPFRGGAIVESTQAVGGVVQEMRAGGSAGVNSYEAYNGTVQPAQDIKAPLIYRGINSAGKTWNTVIVIQNTNLTQSANVTVDFTPDGLGNADSESETIDPGGTWYLGQEGQGGLGSQFFGSAVVTSNRDVAVVVNAGSTDGSGLIAYPTYVSGSAVVYLPGAMKNIPSLGDSYFTSLTIVNMGGSPNVEIEYQPLEGTAGAPYSIQVDTATTVDQRYDAAITSGKFRGTIKLTATGGTIAAMLNVRGDDASTGAFSYASTYSGFSSGESTFFTPYLLKSIPSAGYEWSTSILVQNLDPGGGDLTVNITYNEDPSFGTDSFSSSVVVSEFDFVDLRYDANLTEPTFYGGAKLESGGRPFGVAVLVRGSFGSGDALSSYLGIAPP